MSIQTYGEHAEAAAEALNRLIVDARVPVDAQDVEQLLHCREAVIDAIRQRMYGFGFSLRFAPSLSPSLGNTTRLRGIDNRLAELLGRTAFEAPALPLDKRLSPSELLSRRSSDTTVELWRRAAVELLAGSHVLDIAGDQTWLRDNGAGWYLMRDAAVAMEAFLILDNRLEEIGLLSEHDRQLSSMGFAERRLVASQCARVATWYATSDAPDHAAPQDRRASRVIGPVCLVSTPADLAVAQRRLGAFLRPMSAGNSAYTGEPEISADTARQMVSSQLFLVRVFARMTQDSPKAAILEHEFASRQEILEEIQPQLRYLIDVQAHYPNKHRIWQQSEITTAVRRMQRNRISFALPPARLLELANATHEVTHNLARALRRELLRDNSNLRVADPAHHGGATRVARRSPLEASLTDLVNQPAPTAPVTPLSCALQRAALRETLDLTPSQDRAPNPYPRTSNLARSDLRP